MISLAMLISFGIVTYIVYATFINLFLEPNFSSDHCRDFKYYIREVKEYDMDHNDYNITRYDVRRFHLTTPFYIKTFASFSSISDAWNYIKHNKKQDGILLKRKKKTRLVKKDEVTIDKL